ncbi:MAG: sigma 54-interacting transcriptional regulator [Firmicutes bacterium]|nr:sigma 54-interacting transcriptional regulator [Bacillota bacterium]
MKKSRIVMVSPLPELTRLARQISRELHFNMEIVEAFLDGGVELGKQFEQSGADVIISRGPTGVLLKKELSIPVILIQITNFDIIQALNHAKQIGRKIAYFDHIKRKEVYDFASIAEILSLQDLSLFFYHDERELDEQIKRACNEGIEVIVASGICVIRMARERGMEGVMVFSSREAVIEAMQWAKDVVRIRQKDRERAEFLKTIIDHTYNGVIAVNKEDVVTHFSPAAEEVFKISAPSIVGKKVKDIPVPLLKKFFLNPETIKGEVQKVGERQIVFNHIPIHMDNEPLGAVITFQSVHKLQNLEVTIRKKLHASGLSARYTFNDIVGSSEEIKKAVNRARRYARTDSTVLVTGESGTGKELFVHSIHAESLRREGPFVAVNCANIPKEFLESELFGYEAGAFSGARKGRKAGLFELAHGGTIFLDEISELPLPLQSNLLHVLQEKMVRRIGGERIIPVNVRVIAATNRSLPNEIKKGTFREDLFFHLNVLTLEIPPLRNRRSDIPLLVEHFSRKYRGGTGRMEKFPDSVLRFLSEYDWPGNVRELENFIEKYVILSEGTKENFRLMEELVDELYRFKEDTQNFKHDEERYITVNIGTLEYMERQIIEKLYRQNNLDKKDLASRLGISRTTLWKKLKALETAAQDSGLGP